jgi:hypothetical protein
MQYTIRVVIYKICINLNMAVLCSIRILCIFYQNTERRHIKTLFFNVHGSVHRNNILVYNSNKMRKSQDLFYLTTALHVSGVTITHLREHKTNVTTASGNRYTVLLSAAIVQYGVTVTRCCSYSCFVLLEMSDGDARNM